MFTHHFQLYAGHVKIGKERNQYVLFFLVVITSARFKAFERGTTW